MSLRRGGIKKDGDGHVAMNFDPLDKVDQPKNKIGACFERAD